jgi:predicted phage terminase large subunit-like protein
VSMRWYAAGTEKGAGDFIRAQGVPLRTEAPRGDKFVRAQPVAAAWNAGKVLLPTHGAWLDDFCTELASFTGVNDAHDDMIDALAPAFDLLTPANKIPSYGALPYFTALPRRM